MEERSSTAPEGNTGKTARKLQTSNRYTSVLFQDERGRRHSETYFNRATGIVTMKLLVQDPNGYFIPKIRQIVNASVNRTRSELFFESEYSPEAESASGATASAATHAQSNEEKRQ